MITMTFQNLTRYSDVIFCRNFEGLDLYYPFTDNELYEIFLANKWYQLGKNTKKAKTLWMSKIFSKPL